MELPVVTFIRERISEVNSEFETRPGSAYHEMFIKPQELMLQPLNNTMDQIQVSQSIRRILAQPDPDAYSEDDVDDLVANLYVDRDAGAFATTTVRVYYTAPVDKAFPAFSAEFTAGSLSFFNSADVSITSQEMSLQTEGTYYYVDIAVRAQSEGEAYSVPAGAITGFVNDSDAVRVTNLSDATGGLDRETNTQLLNRAQNSIGVRDLETVKGINAILRQEFPSIRDLQAIGFGDPEMQRDIVYNTHIGGRTDVYIKMPALTTATQDFIGMDYDSTREISRQLHIQMARSEGDAILPSYTGTPEIVVGSVKVSEDITETSAVVESVAIPPGTGVNLVGKEWLKLQIDSLAVVSVKVSGATPSQTQRFEIINSINAAMGYTVATPAPGNKIRITSLTVGLGSSITFMDTTPLTQAAQAIFGFSVFPAVTEGVAAEKYVETADYNVNYTEGNIFQTAYGPRHLPTILSGQVMVTGTTDGQITQVGSNYFFDSTISSRFYDVGSAIKVREGDEVTITEIDGATTGTVIGDLPQTFVVTQVVNTQRLTLQNFNPTGADGQIAYSIKSNQVVVIDYKYNPISIDIGGQVLLADGLNRGVRPGRSGFTITNTPFIDIISVQEIDPESGETIADPLIPPQGYGYGGFGEGAYGVGAGGDYDFQVLSPRERYSVFDSAVILFGQDALSRSYRVTYRWVPEIVPIHNLTRNDTERVTGADVLAKSYVPAFASIPIVIVRDPTNTTTPTDDALATLVQNFVNGKSGSVGVESSDIIKLLEDQGVDKVQVPFTMTAVVKNPDGTTTILESTDKLVFPDVTLPSDTENYTTKKITYFFPDQITVTEATS